MLAWILPQLHYGRNVTLGRFVIVSAPQRVSQWFGRGTRGLEVFRFVQGYGQLVVFGVRCST